jgi:3-deoxy-D-manno-octulosonate 8-phosphate phosphatase (KDO 8-P phosphatase)
MSNLKSPMSNQQSRFHSATVSVQRKAARVRLLLFDVDGVLTDGRVWLHADGTEMKQFDIRDGAGMVCAKRAGLMIGFLSARTSAATRRRAAEIGVTLVKQGVASKLRTYEGILRQHRLTDAEVAYMGDDLLDLPVLARVGLPTAPADAVKDVHDRVVWVSRAAAGRGAARELIEMVLTAQGRWDRIVRNASLGRPAQGAERRGARTTGKTARTGGRRRGSKS